MKIKSKEFIKSMLLKIAIYAIAICLAALTVRVITNNTDGRRQIVDEDGGKEILLPAPTSTDENVGE